MWEALIPLVIIGIIAWALHHLWERFIGVVTIYDYETGLRYNQGKFDKELGPGKYYYFIPETEIMTEDTRLRSLTAAGQEILTKDNVNIKISMVMSWCLTDFLKSQNASQYYYTDLYDAFQMAIRQSVEEYELDELLANRNIAVEKIMEVLKPLAEDLGVEVKAVGVRDIMLPAALKRAYSGALEARKDAEREIEKARGEQAVLRKLSNLAKMVEDNPGLMQLRTLQAFSESDNVSVFLGDGFSADKVAGQQIR